MSSDMSLLRLYKRMHMTEHYRGQRSDGLKVAEASNPMNDFECIYLLSLVTPVYFFFIVRYIVRYSRKM